ncbi:peptide MFS transporter [Weissella thailandensis]|uniref:Peptide MFS transporter n=1 Tax=Weissella thailandensis TaxID=89061 RepID=A0ABX9I6J7_9LACO|nr:peptide MFS transporter [Weissella thailandensis]NKY90196.1 peptide MFS transporter [Weissella thailandensis]RDS60273.1 peptide MFS transporter [Weissella thailandensis]
MNQKDSASFFGQPRGLMTLFFTEMWERFSYYGMRAILLFYMVYAADKGGLGFNAVTGAAIMSIYGSMVYLSGIIGGYLADRVLGSWRTVFYGGVLIMFGHIALSMPLGTPGLFGSIVPITLGTGLLKPNVATMVGNLYDKDDERRDAGFSIYVFGINLGSFVSPILVGWFQVNVNFHVAFSLAAIGMFIGLVQYTVDGRKHLSNVSRKAPSPLQPEEMKSLGWKLGLILIAIILILFTLKGTNSLNIDSIINVLTAVAILVPVVYFVVMLTSSKTTKFERRKVIAYIPLFIAAMLFWIIEEQGSVVLALFAANQTALHGIPASWFQSLNPLFIMLFTPFFVWLWSKKLSDRQPATGVKFALGLVFAGLSYVWMAFPGMLFGVNNHFNPLWLVASWALVEVGEMLISPVGLSASAKMAPVAFQAQMLTVWNLSDATAQAANAQLVKLYSPDTEVTYFLIIGFITVLAGLLLWVATKKIKILNDSLSETN